MAGPVGVRALAIAPIAAVVLAGCGGHSSTRSTTTSERDAGQHSAAPQLPVVDRDAFVGIARASGELRAGTAAVAIGKAQRISGRGQIASARRMVAGLRPRDGQLLQLKRQIDVALRDLLAASSDPRTESGAAKAALAATTRINRGLHSYADRHPSLALAIPD
jgi:hypothetical protein